MGIGTNLKQILTSRNMTLKELSECSGISINTLYSITKKDSDNINQTTLSAISKSLDVEPFELLDWDKKYNVDKIKKDIEFIEYLKNIGYTVISDLEPIEWDVNLDGSKYPIVYDESPDAPCCTIIKDSASSVFTNQQFKDFQKEIEKSVEFNAYQYRSNKK